MRIFGSCGLSTMKIYFLIFFLGFTAVSMGQSIENIQKRLKLLNTDMKVKFDTTGFSKLPRFSFFCTSEIVITEEGGTEKIVPSETQEPWKYYSVIDLNNDGLNDLIYSGPCSVYDQTGVFVNDGKTLQLVYDYPGRIISIEQNGIRTTINSLYQPTGCDPDNELTEIVISKGISATTNRISFANIPKLNLDELKKVKIKGMLRWSPKQDDMEKKEGCFDRLVKGNHLLLIDKLTEVIQLKQSGRWLLILYKKNKDESIIGWIEIK
jgi:hypothetical protein